MIDYRQLKINAKEAMAQTRPRPFWVTLAVFAILLALSVLSMFVSGQWNMLREFYATMDYDILMEGAGISVFAWFLSLALGMMSIVLSVGYRLYALKVNRRESASFGTVLDAFGVFFRAVWISYLRNIIIGAVFIGAYMVIGSVLSMVLLMPQAMSEVVQDPDMLLDTMTWTLFLAVLAAMIPAVIVSYSYSQGVFIMLDNPQLSAMQCLALSRAVMRGHKWEYFRLCLSFIGWIFLSIVPFVGLWVMAYMRVTMAGYYDAIMPGFMEKMKAAPFVFTPRESGQPPRYHVPGEGSDDSDDNSGENQ